MVDEVQPHAGGRRDTEDGHTEGGDAEGGDAEGGDAEGGDAEGGDAEGGEAEGGHAEVDPAEGGADDDRADDDRADDDEHHDGEDGDERRPRVVVPDEGHGTRIIQASWVGTGLYTAAAVADLVAVRSLAPAVILVSSALFVIGLGAFMAAYVIAIGRSREVLIGMGGLYFLAGTAPVRVQRHLLGSFAAQVVVATVTASIGVAIVPEDASNPLAFGFLVPLYGLGLAGLWGARFGTFAPRPDEGGRGRG